MQTVTACPWYETLEHFSMEVMVEAERVAKMDYVLQDSEGFDIAVFIEATAENEQRLLKSWNECFGTNETELEMPTMLIDGTRYYVSGQGWCWDR